MQARSHGPRADSQSCRPLPLLPLGNPLCTVVVTHLSARSDRRMDVPVTTATTVTGLSTVPLRETRVFGERRRGQDSRVLKGTVKKSGYSGYSGYAPHFLLGSDLFRVTTKLPLLPLARVARETGAVCRAETAGGVL